MREWPHGVRSSQRLLNQKAFGVRNDNGKPLASGKRELRACPFRSRMGQSRLSIAQSEGEGSFIEPTEGPAQFVSARRVR